MEKSLLEILMTGDTKIKIKETILEDLMKLPNPFCTMKLVPDKIRDRCVVSEIIMPGSLNSFVKYKSVVKEINYLVIHFDYKSLNRFLVLKIPINCYLGIDNVYHLWLDVKKFFPYYVTIHTDSGNFTRRLPIEKGEFDRIIDLFLESSQNYLKNFE